MTIFFFLFAIIISLHAFATAPLNEIRQIDAAGNELIIRGPHLELDEKFGIISVPNSRHELIKLKLGKEVHRTVATIDSGGFRTSPASHLKGKSKHVLLIDSSMVFGEALSEDQTLFHLINLKSKLYEAYPVAFYGYGPQQAWLRFKMGKLPQQVREKSGSAIIFTHESDIQRLFGAISTLSYTQGFPNIQEQQQQFIQLGSFRNSGSWLQKFVINFCLPFRACALWASHFEPGKLTDDQYEIAGRLFDDVGKMYSEQFAAEEFTIVWVGLEANSEKFSKFTKNKVIFFASGIQESYSDGHKNAKGIKSLSDFLFNLKLIR